jgi:hypothetical protein
MAHTFPLAVDSLVMEPFMVLLQDVGRSMYVVHGRRPMETVTDVSVLMSGVQQARPGSHTVGP